MLHSVTAPFEVVHADSIVCTVLVLGDVLVASATCLVQLDSTVRWPCPAWPACLLNVLIAAMSSISGYVVRLQSCTMAEISGCLHKLSNVLQLTWGSAHITRHGDRHGDRHCDRQGQP